jgi:hypothetical protein
MKKGVIWRAVIAVLSAAACGGDDGPTALGTTARVRFFNATTGMTGSGGFTTNGQFATGSALAFGQSTPTCATVSAGSTSFGFGATNSGGTGLSGVAMATLNNQSITAGGNFTVATAGSPTNATLFLLDNTFSGTLASNQAAVRFVNLAPQSGTTTVNTFNVFKGTLGADGTPVALNIEVGAPTPFTTVTLGSSAYTILQGHMMVIPPSEGTLSLQAGTVNTIAIVPDPASGGFRMATIPACA